MGTRRAAGVMTPVGLGAVCLLPVLRPESPISLPRFAMVWVRRPAISASVLPLARIRFEPFVRVVPSIWARIAPNWALPDLPMSSSITGYAKVTVSSLLWAVCPSFTLLHLVLLRRG